MIIISILKKPLSLKRIVVYCLAVHLMQSNDFPPPVTTICRLFFGTKSPSLSFKINLIPLFVANPLDDYNNFIIKDRIFLECFLIV